MSVRAVIGTVVLALLAASCSSQTNEDGLVVVATTSVLGDIVSNVVGDDAQVVVLMPAGADPHDFRASARQVAEMEAADLIVANGLGLEQGLDDVLDGIANSGGELIGLAETASPIPYQDGGALNPHFWMDPTRVALAVDEVAAALERLAPGGRWSERAADYQEALAATDLEITELLSVLNPPRRLLVTNHDSLGYFAQRYGFEVAGVIVPGGSTLAEPSSAHLAELVDTISDRSVPVIFAENTEPANLAEAIAAEAGAEVVTLYVGSVGGPGSGAESLIDMLRRDARLIAESLS